MSHRIGSRLVIFRLSGNRNFVIIKLIHEPQALMDFFMGRKQMIKEVLTILQTLTSLGTLCIMLYTLKKFLLKPHNTLDERLTALELEMKENKQSLLQGNDRFRECEREFKKQKRTNATFKTVMLAFVNYEIAYCQNTDYTHTEELMKAKSELEKYLTNDDDE